jgi:ABC-type nitrate/sulfonate/bicarbonate transport system permease component
LPKKKITKGIEMNAEEPKGLFFFAPFQSRQHKDSLLSNRRPKNKLARPIFFMTLAIVLLFIAIILLESYLSTNQIPKSTMPLPSEIYNYLKTDLTVSNRFHQQNLLEKTMESLQDAFWGFSISIILGSLIGIAYAKLSIFKNMTRPLLFIIQLLPVPAFAPVIAAIFGYDSTAKILIIVMFTIYPVVATIEHSVRSIPSDYYSLTRSFNSNRLNTIKTLVLPGIVPKLFTSMRIISTAAFTGSIIAELPLPITRGIGKDLYNSYNNQLHTRVWSSLVMIGVVGLVFYLSITIIGNLFQKKFRYGEFE